MSIVTSTQSLQNQLASFLSERQRIDDSKVYSSDFKQSQRGDLTTRTVPGLETTVTRLWGTFERIDPESPMPLMRLSDSGEAWKAYDGAKNRVSTEGENANTVDYSVSSGAIARLKSTLRLYSTPESWRTHYEHQLSADLKYAAQEYAADIFPNDSVWTPVMLRLEGDRRQRLNTPALKAAVAALTALYPQMDAAIKVTKSVSDTFGKDSPLLLTVGSAIGRKMLFDDDPLALQGTIIEYSRPTVLMSVGVSASPLFAGPAGERPPLTGVGVFESE